MRLAFSVTQLLVLHFLYSVLLLTGGIKHSAPEMLVPNLKVVVQKT